MAEEKSMRLSQVARKLNVGRHTIIDFLADKGFEIDTSPNSKISAEQFTMLSKEFADSAHEKEEASSLTIGTKMEGDLVIESGAETKKKEEEEEAFFDVCGAAFGGLSILYHLIVWFCTTKTGKKPDTDNTEDTNDI